MAAAYSLPGDIGSGPFSACSGGGPAYACTGDIDLNNNDSVSLTADVTLNIDGEIDFGKNVILDNNGFVFNLNATGDINIDDSAQINASLDTAGKIDLGKDVVVNGNVTAAGEIKIGDDASISGNIDSGDKIDLGKSVTVNGEITAVDEIKIGDDANITGSIDSGDKIDIGKRLVLSGNVIANGDIKIDDDPTIVGNITSSGKIEIGKRGSITGDLDAGDDIKIEDDVVINGDVTTSGNLDIGNRSVVNGTCIPSHPQCTGPPPPTGGTCDTFRDEFLTFGYSNQDGTLNWATDWIEVGDNGSHTSGDILLQNNSLRLRGGGSAVNVLGGPFVQREADLSAFSTATLSFDYRETGGWEADDQVDVYISSDGGSNWTLIQSFIDDQGNNFQAFTIDITNYISSNTRIAFVERADANGESFYIDNVEIEACLSPVDHFNIIPATTSASTCLPNAITIVAADAADNPIPDYTGRIDISVSTNHGNWSVNDANNVTDPDPDIDDDGDVDYSFVIADAGDIILDLSNTRAETLTITVTDAAAGVSETSVPITFADNVFVFSEDPVQVAGRPQSIDIAMYTNDGSNCFIDTSYNYSGIDLDTSIDRNGVLPGAADPSIGGVSIPDTPGSAVITLDFSAIPGQSGFILDTTDVGQYRLTVVDNSNTHGVGPIIGTSNVLTVRPFGFAVESIETGPAGSPTPNPGGSGDSGAIFTTAGSAFRATLTAVLWESGDDLDNDGVLDSGTFNDNAATPGYDFRTDLVALTTGFTPPAPAGSLGTLNNASRMAGDFTSGVASFADSDNMHYTEVGSFTLQAQTDNYLGAPGVNIRGESIVVGRFIPAEFRVTSIDNAGEFREACTTFTYIGEDFTYETAPSITVTAYNALGDVTANYIDAGPGNNFVKLGTGSLTVAATRDEVQQGTDLVLLDVDYVQAATLAPVPDPVNPGSVSITLGADSYRYGPGAPLGEFSKLPNSQVAPFQPNIMPSITAITDGEVNSSVAASFTPAATPLSMRFGRLRMDNVFGSELNPLVMPVFTEYWTGAGFVRNIEDTCTSIQNGDLDFNPAGCADPVVIEDPAMAGTIDYRFPSPGAGNDGSVTTTTVLGTTRADHLWLRYDWDNDNDFDDDPEATASFGIFKGDPVQIYSQQIFQ